ncbi:Uncharacterised protein [Neisseria animalis]|nr:Uncharacterised protein [Neisseria animalis]
MIQRCFALPYYVYCLRLRCLVSFLFYSTIQRLVRAGFTPIRLLRLVEVETFKVFNFRADVTPLPSVLVRFLFFAKVSARLRKTNHAHQQKSRLQNAFLIRFADGFVVRIFYFSGVMFMYSNKKLVNAGLFGLLSMFFQRCCQPRKVL